MQPEDPLERTELTFLLGTAFQVVLSEFVARLDAAGYADLRPVHGLVFQLLSAEGATGSELAERLGITKQAAGQTVDDLERRGYVERRPHPAGGRRKLVVLTDKARTHLRVAGENLHRLEGELAGRLADRGLALPRRELAAIIRALAGEDIPPLRPVW
ncbi:MarR family transcriptional regulator [Streptomyces sp. YIM 98790]|uniref:MarR family winged helix-turn-helix transcriptional regulator n=1 Tax=Streptomyces sp. YIM 98790 TaxID=2689077 RepID=UPI00140D2558|nr:MarR family transcriptional regulator [Streptomyces sp. YIM 98790]